MANSSDSLTALITEFRSLQAKDSISPESIGVILQRIVDSNILNIESNNDFDIKSITIQERPDNSLSLTVCNEKGTTKSVTIPLAGNTQSGIVSKDDFKKIQDAVQLSQFLPIAQDVENLSESISGFDIKSLTIQERPDNSLSLTVCNEKGTTKSVTIPLAGNTQSGIVSKDDYKKIQGAVQLSQFLPIAQDVETLSNSIGKTNGIAPLDEKKYVAENNLPPRIRRTFAMFHGFVNIDPFIMQNAVVKPSEEGGSPLYVYYNLATNAFIGCDSSLTKVSVDDTGNCVVLAGTGATSVSGKTIFKNWFNADFWGTPRDNSATIGVRPYMFYHYLYEGSNNLRKQYRAVSIGDDNGYAMYGLRQICNTETGSGADVDLSPLIDDIANLKVKVSRSDLPTFNGFEQTHGSVNSKTGIYFEHSSGLFFEYGKDDPYNIENFNIWYPSNPSASHVNRKALFYNDADGNVYRVKSVGGVDTLAYLIDFDRFNEVVQELARRISVVDRKLQNMETAMEESAGDDDAVMQAVTAMQSTVNDVVDNTEAFGVDLHGVHDQLAYLARLLIGVEQDGEGFDPEFSGEDQERGLIADVEDLKVEVNDLQSSVDAQIETTQSLTEQANSNTRLISGAPIDPENDHRSEMAIETEAEIRQLGIIPSLVNMSENNNMSVELIQSMMERIETLETEIENLKNGETSNE